MAQMNQIKTKNTQMHAQVKKLRFVELCKNHSENQKFLLYLCVFSIFQLIFTRSMNYNTMWTEIQLKWSFVGMQQLTTGSCSTEIYSIKSKWKRNRFYFCLYACRYLYGRVSQNKEVNIANFWFCFSLTAKPLTYEQALK